MIETKIRSNDYACVVADSFEVLVDTGKTHGQVIGLKVNPVNADSFIMPIELKTARGLAECIAATVLACRTR